MAHILIIDDEEKMRNLLSIMLERKGYSIDQANDGKNALTKLLSSTYDLVISDIKMPEIDGKELIIRMRKQGIVTPVVFITAFATIDSAVEMMRHGAVDYVTKPFDDAKIQLTVTRALNLSSLITENQEMKEELKKADGNKKLVYKSNSMKNVIELSESVASVDTAVLISGESGTGKELVARHIHARSLRSGKRFVPINCAAISPNLVESELFGYEKGAFTGANSRKTGKFELANKGSLFLDEIAEMDPNMQSKLLRVIQEKELTRVGGNTTIKFDARIIVATNKDLAEEVRKGKFREDLYYRLLGLSILLPPLRYRGNDILILSRYFLDDFCNENKLEKKTISPKAKEKLMNRAYPGNVRELKAIIELAAVMSNNKVIEADNISFTKTNLLTDLLNNEDTLSGYTKKILKHYLEKFDNNVVKVASKLDIGKSTIYRMIKENEL